MTDARAQMCNGCIWMYTRKSSKTKRRLYGEYGMRNVVVIQGI